MSKKEGEKNFEFLGLPYQKRLVAQFVLDYKFANNIMDIVDPNYFSDQYLRMIVAEIKEAHESNEVIPDIDSIGFRIANKNKNKLVNQFVGAQLTEIKELTLNDSDEVQNLGMKFCQQQELRKSIREMQDIIDNGNLNDYDRCEDILKKALDVGAEKDDGIDIFSNLDLVLSEDFRKPIATGIVGLDAKMNGGLSRTELAVILAPFGVGKTTMLTKIANSAFENGNKVLQIFFEDTPKIIQRKHLACWTEIEINELGNPDNRERINALVKEKSNAKGYLMLKKFPSDGTTMPMIKQYVRKLAASGRKPDIILIDYIDCVAPSKSNANQSEWNSEGVIMRQFETLLTEFDMAGWTAIQGNRSSISAQDVDSSMLGGSIKKGQIAHFLVSIAKSLEQKETGRANMAILKSRFGLDGIIFSDILFDNARIQIDVEPGAGQTVSETQMHKEEDNANRMIEIMAELTKKKQALAIEENNQAPKKIGN